MAEAGGPESAVELIMSITPAEFETGLERFTGASIQRVQGGAYALTRPDLGAHLVRCVFEPLPDVLLGGLMRLPRARVTLFTGDMPADARVAFLALFDRTFQRGGG